MGGNIQPPAIKHGRVDNLSFFNSPGKSFHHFGPK